MGFLLHGRFKCGRDDIVNRQFPQDPGLLFPGKYKRPDGLRFFPFPQFQRFHQVLHALAPAIKYLVQKCFNH